MVNFPVSLLLMVFLKRTSSGGSKGHIFQIHFSVFSHTDSGNLIFFSPEKSTRKHKPPSYFWSCPWTFAPSFHCIFCLNHFGHRSGKKVTKICFNQINQNYTLNFTHHLGNSSKQLISVYNLCAYLCVKTELYKSTHI